MANSFAFFSELSFRRYLTSGIPLISRHQLINGCDGLCPFIRDHSAYAALCLSTALRFEPVVVMTIHAVTVTEIAAGAAPPLVRAFSPVLVVNLQFVGVHALTHKLDFAHEPIKTFFKGRSMMAQFPVLFMSSRR
jgi:hypothetical protein